SRIFAVFYDFSRTQLHLGFERDRPDEDLSERDSWHESWWLNPRRKDLMAATKRKSKADNRIQQVDPKCANGKAKRLIGRVKEKLGLVPNVFRVLANAPVALEGYLSLLEALADGVFGDRTRQQIALTVAETNLCAYSVSTQTLLAEKAGVTPDEIADATRACATDARTDALLK